MPRACIGKRRRFRRKLRGNAVSYRRCHVASTAASAVSLGPTAPSSHRSLLLQSKVGQAESAVRFHHPLRKTPLFFEFSLCLSRACLGKMMIYIYKWRKKWRFPHHNMQPALARSMHLFVAEPSSEHALSNHPHPPIDAGRHQHPAATQQHPGGTTQQAGGRRQLAAGPNATFARHGRDCMMRRALRDPMLVQGRSGNCCCCCCCCCCCGCCCCMLRAACYRRSHLIRSVEVRFSIRLLPTGE